MLDCPPSGYWTLWTTAYEGARLRGGYPEAWSLGPDSPNADIHIPIFTATMQDSLPAAILELQADNRHVPRSLQASGWVPGLRIFPIDAPAWQEAEKPRFQLIGKRMEAVIRQDGRDVLPLIVPESAAGFLKRFASGCSAADKPRIGRPEKPQHALAMQRIRGEIEAEISGSASRALRRGRKAHYERRFLEMAADSGCDPGEATARRWVTAILTSLRKAEPPKGS